MQLRERFAYIQAETPSPPKPRGEPILPPSVKRSESALGPVYFAEQFWPLDYRHGAIVLEDALNLDSQIAERLGSSLLPSDFREAAFIDIETSGLSGGTGTYAFMIGVGTFEGFAFRIRQFFLADLSEEAAMLSAVANTIDRKTMIVSFNGRTFDLPQLATRYALNRLPPLAAEMPHVDLLFPARRLFRRRLDSYRLGVLEQTLLGLRRHDDVPGWLIPSLYFSYIQRGQGFGLSPVFQHNALDLLSLVTFLGYLGDIAGTDYTGDAEHSLALGVWDESQGRLNQAQRLYDLAWHSDPAADAGGEAVRRLARLSRRRGDWQDSERLWQAEIQTTTAPQRQIFAAVELAKIFEHRRRDFVAAFGQVRVANQILIGLPRHERPLSVTLGDLEHRSARLERRLGSYSED